jgi:eukaryotic-like serine/threonine-protein kinase
MATTLPAGSPIPFLRRRDYVFVKALGQGACGETVLLRDEQIDSLFVCKKYSPYSEARRQELFKNFVREIKLLHDVHHQNVVRVFNYYIYPEKCTGYILMEYVDGSNVEEHLRSQPETINEVFRQAIDGFAYLEQCQILHRDIRPGNLLVRQDGIVKIIDLGFGKRVQATKDFDKSISLNWWCEPPSEFAIDTYDHTTEVYFVGKLFEQLIAALGIEQFKHAALLERMCRRLPEDRIQSFADARNDLTLKRSEDIDFADHERDAYRCFADAVLDHITKIENGTKYTTDLDVIRTKLEAAYRNCMLEETMPDCVPVLRAVLTGQYYYRRAGFDTWIVRDFVRFLRSAPIEKHRIVLANLHTRLDAVTRYSVPSPEDDIPF